jgi:predicted acetyltransferase
MPKLELPKLEYIPSYVAALREGYRVGIQAAKAEEEILPIEENPQGFLDDFFAVNNDPITYPDGTVLPRVPYTKFWYMDGDHFIGEISVRHQLNEKLIVTGGHIGYGTRPSEQNKGRATQMLRLALDFCREKLSLDKVLMTVGDENAPSIKVIEKNGGVLENRVTSIFDGKPARRYWITL